MKKEYTRPEIKVMEIQAERAMLAGSNEDSKEGIPSTTGGVTEDPVESKGSGFSVWDEEY